MELGHALNVTLDFSLILNEQFVTPNVQQEQSSIQQQTFVNHAHHHVLLVH